MPFCTSLVMDETKRRESPLGQEIISRCLVLETDWTSECVELPSFELSA